MSLLFSLSFSINFHLSRAITYHLNKPLPVCLIPLPLPWRSTTTWTAQITRAPCLSPSQQGSGWVQHLLVSWIPLGYSHPPVLEPSTAIHALVCLATYARLQQCEVDLAQGPSFLWNYTHSSAKGAGPRHDVGDSSVSSFGSPPPFAAPVSSLNVDEERKSLGGEKAEGIRKASSEGARQRKHVAGRASSSSNRKGGSQQAHFGLVEEGQENFYFQVTGTGPPCSPGSKERLPLVVIERLMEAVGENLSRSVPLT